jgi:KRAB domain-containing zinc finger protein
MSRADSHKHVKKNTKRTISPRTLHHCYFCLKPISSQCNLFTHLTVHTKEQPYKCQKCFRSFSRHDLLVGHISRNYCVPGGLPKNRATNKCYFCNTNFPANHILSTHLRRVHLLEGFARCHICSKQFPNKSTLKIHTQMVHLGQRNYKCELCCRMYGTRSAVYEHIRVTHTREKNFGCYFCNKSDTAFSSGAKLMEHMKKHTGEKPFFCYFCNVQFARDSGLNAHLVIMHTKERPFRCSKCPDREFPLKGQLNNHIRRMHTHKSSRSAK